jgi:type II secretory pathway pseudopilin PulG
VVGTTRATLLSAMSISLTTALPRIRSNERGSSMLEVMTVVVIIGITAAIAVPNYLRWNRTYQLRQATTDMHSNLTLARMAAMNRNTTVTMTLGPIACPPETTYCGVNGVSFGGIFPPLPLAVNNITWALVPASVPSTVQLSSLGLRVGPPAGSPPVGDQVITLTNTDNLKYSIVITPGGKIRWCAANTCK